MNIHQQMLMLVSILYIYLSSLVVANSDFITDLPGLSWKPNFKHYSGYLAATGTKRLHYWFVESAGNPAKDPVILWLNGGPGCSSMDGLLNEHGPFLITDDGITLQKNPNSWNKIANVLYLEAPAGVGYSYSADKQYKTSDIQVAKDNHAALLSFFQMYPDFRTNDFYVTGESYGGIYVPTLSVLVAADSSINFKGFAVGNGLSNATMNDNSLIYFGFYHALYGKSLWNSLVNNCCKDVRLDQCDFVHSQEALCQQALAEASSIIGQMNIYNLYEECYAPPSAHLSDRRNTSIIHVPDLWLLNTIKKYKHVRSADLHYMTLKVVPPCVNLTALTNYLNNPDVRQALHIPTELPAWEICSGVVGGQYIRDFQDVAAQYKEILSSGKYRIMVYNGDTDMACNFLGDEWFVDSLNQELTKKWQPWYYTDIDGSRQIAGFRKQYKNLNFVTIKGAGHMVPQDKPVPAFDMFSAFINDQL